MRKLLMLCALAGLPLAAQAADGPESSTWLSDIWAAWNDIEVTVAETVGWIDPVGQTADHAGWIDPAGFSADPLEEPGSITSEHFGWIDPAGVDNSGDLDASAGDASTGDASPPNQGLN